MPSLPIPLYLGHDRAIPVRRGISEAISDEVVYTDDGILMARTAPAMNRLLPFLKRRENMMD